MRTLPTEVVDSIGGRIEPAPEVAPAQRDAMSEKKKFLLRLDGRLFEVLEKWASDDLRSINAQIEFLLTDTARKAGRLKNPSPLHPYGSDAATEGR